MAWVGRGVQEQGIHLLLRCTPACVVCWLRDEAQGTHSVRVDSLIAMEEVCGAAAVQELPSTGQSLPRRWECCASVHVGAARGSSVYACCSWMLSKFECDA